MAQKTENEWTYFGIPEPIAQLPLFPAVGSQ